VAAAIPEFGALDAQAVYVLRPGGYVVLFNAAGKVAAVSTPLGLALPGGGQEQGEPPEDAAIREVEEECGLRITLGQRIGIADELVFAADERTHYRKRCTFFLAEVVGRTGTGEPVHELVWLSGPDAVARLLHESQRWAVSEAWRRMTAFQDTMSHQRPQQVSKTLRPIEGWSVLIRPEQPGDVAAVHAVHAAAFPTDEEARIVDALRGADQLSISLVAEDGGRVVGHIAFSPVTLTGATRGLGLAPVAVVPEYQRRGIGGQLIREGLAAAARSGAAFVVVLGHPDYYPRFGFRRAGPLGLDNEYGADEAFMVLELQPGSLPAGGGLVRYRAEFAACSRPS
jgi:putative acetyltransferase